LYYCLVGFSIVLSLHFVLLCWFLNFYYCVYLTTGSLYRMVSLDRTSGFIFAVVASVSTELLLSVAKLAVIEAVYIHHIIMQARDRGCLKMIRWPVIEAA